MKSPLLESGRYVFTLDDGQRVEVELAFGHWPDDGCYRAVIPAGQGINPKSRGGYTWPVEALRGAAESVCSATGKMVVRVGRVLRAGTAAP